MCELTKKAIAAVLSADETATEEERRRVAEALAGVPMPMTICEAAERLGVSRPKLYMLIRQGRLSRIADGRVDGKSVAEYLKPRKEGGDV